MRWVWLGWQGLISGTVRKHATWQCNLMDGMCGALRQEDDFLCLFSFMVKMNQVEYTHSKVLTPNLVLLNSNQIHTGLVTLKEAGNKSNYLDRATHSGRYKEDNRDSNSNISML